MKKYVAKEDVEKGLVNISKPLNQQKEYLDKIEREEKERHHNRHWRDAHTKAEHKNKPTYNWNRRDVTEDTPLPEAP
jgi:hypothetical protein